MKMEVKAVLSVSEDGKPLKAYCVKTVLSGRHLGLLPVAQWQGYCATDSPTAGCQADCSHRARAGQGSRGGEKEVWPC